MTTTLTELDRARDVALDLSGWGRRFVFYQPRNFAFWGYLALVGIGVLTFFSTLAREYNAYGEAIGLAVTSFAIYAALFWWFTDRIDHYAKLPHKLMVVAFVWGGFAATGTMAANANDAILAMYGKTFGQVWALNWGAGLAAPFTEELAKGSGLLLLIALAQRHVRTAFDGFILGAFIGLGFQIVEDITLRHDLGRNPVRRQPNWGLGRHHHPSHAHRGGRSYPLQRNLLRRCGLPFRPAR